MNQFLPLMTTLVHLACMVLRGSHYNNAMQVTWQSYVHSDLGADQWETRVVTSPLNWRIILIVFSHWFRNLIVSNNLQNTVFGRATWDCHTHCSRPPNETKIAMLPIENLRMTQLNSYQSGQWIFAILFWFVVSIATSTGHLGTWTLVAVLLWHV